MGPVAKKSATGGRVENLRATAMRFRLLAGAGIIGIAVLDSGDHIREANDVFVNMTGYTREELHSERMGWRKLTAPEHEKSLNSIFEEIKKHRASGPWVQEFVRKDGARIPVFAGATRLPGPDEFCLCYVFQPAPYKPSIGPGDPSGLLTRREREIIWMLAEGKSNKEVAAALGIGVRTAEGHRTNIRRKLNLRSTADMVRFVLGSENRDD
jgi:PAS domain S-box-containing protein